MSQSGHRVEGLVSRVFFKNIFWRKWFETHCVRDEADYLYIVSIGFGWVTARTRSRVRV